MIGKDSGPARPEENRAPDSPETGAFQRAAQNLLDAIAAEPVPERLRRLAMELDAALERRRAGAKGQDGGGH